jgi:hypothetical protein
MGEFWSFGIWSFDFRVTIKVYSFITFKTFSEITS